MTPITFKGQNTVFGYGQPEYQPLPAFTNEEGIVVSCWRLTWFERVYLLFRGRLYLQQLTFNKPLQPLLPAVKSPLVFRETDKVANDEP